MKRLAALTLFLLTTTLMFSGNDEKPVLSKSPLSEDQIAIYNTFLTSYNNGYPGTVNVSSMTNPLRLHHESMDRCITGVPLEDMSHARRVFHLLDASRISAKHIRLVNPKKHKIADPGPAIRSGKSVKDAVDEGFAAGLLSLSEIVFDKEQKRAYMQFWFYCGGLCGNGNIVVFEKEGNQWKQASSCGGWIS